ncbi:adenine phosphoribosyltransferase [Ohtaekwangia koreensis]|jgi:adenine phosphoribosyltransferase|uniref:Adenine phosphoribosyltransferase n=1 Tax=Ohtaekwangia koreensis TaxID=688867 RepID=A0A1T5JFV8_9BACT|nr:adenine phosphoribosyltransferase [Ohtaekwangia koreensis]SKC50048.1 adenine phosphoribosyltransferase [Ohtaekwangia koreensis]
MQLSEKIKHAIRDVQDYPKPGIVFKDITPVLADPSLMHEIARQLKNDFQSQKIDAIAAVEARGFIFGSILAHELNCRFIPIRKAGKLPYKVRRREYDLEYGTACIEMHEDAIQPGWQVLVQDDLLATGGTASAAGELIESVGAKVAGFSFIINLSFLPGYKKLQERFGVNPQYLIEY